MKHKSGYNRLGRKASHRQAMLKNMATSLLRYERIRTTKAKAKELRKLVERLITRANVDSVQNRRVAGTTIGDKEVLAKLFTDIGPRYASRPGGYTRIIKLGHRQGDAAEMVFIELVEEELAETKSSSSQAKKRTPKPEKPENTKPAEEETADADEAVESAAAETDDTGDNAESSEGEAPEESEESTESEDTVETPG